MTLLRRSFLAALCLALAFATNAQAREITLFDSEGEAVAYIDTSDEATIYLWSGKPVTYLDGNSIYGFNGKHLGWFDQGVIRDHNGNGVGFIQGAVNKLTRLEGLKSLKSLKPLKSLKELEPLKSLNSSQWSRLPLELFLLSGSN
jgi:hypothetical protein